MSHTQNQKQLGEFRARLKFQRVLEQLLHEARMGLLPRRALDYIVDHLETLLEQMGDSKLRDAFREQLAEVKEKIAIRHRFEGIAWSESVRRMLGQRGPAPSEGGAA